jgi:hypothetical protein
VQNECQDASTFQKARIKKPSAPRAQNVQKERQGAMTFQKVRNKQPSAKKGASTFKTNRTKRPSAQNKKKNTLGTIETWMPEWGETFFHPTPRNQSLDPHETKRTKPLKTTVRKKEGRCFSKNTKFPRIASGVSR